MNIERPSSQFSVEEKTNEPMKLQVPLEKTIDQRKQFSQKFIKITKHTALRPLYEEYIDQIGVNGIMDVVQKISPKCHGEGHDLGKVIFSKLNDLGSSLRTCKDGCYSGCMHGVFMEVFKLEENGHSHGPASSEHQVHSLVESIKDRIPEICYQGSVTQMYKEGDCSHAVGHAVMFVLDYDIPRALGHCRLFDQEALKYYCATGAYMEYVAVRGQDKKEGESLFYPCDSEEFPAACFRYKMVHVFRNHFAHGGEFTDIVKQCTALKGKYRLGCFHGVGNAHMGNIAAGNVPISYVCGFGNKDDQYMCIEGAAERMGKYHPKNGLLRCQQQLTGWKRDVCIAGVQRKMYDLKKPFKNYF
ncbi:MAG TPA: hypothetical protein VGB26_05830 [Nitrospiria bacterium]|jgi:hypothetical protein